MSDLSHCDHHFPFVKNDVINFIQSCGGKKKFPYNVAEEEIIRYEKETISSSGNSTWIWSDFIFVGPHRPGALCREGGAADHDFGSSPLWVT